MGKYVETNKYGWVGANQTEVVVLQDFRWSPKLICWKDLLLLLEVELLKCPSSKNQFAIDACINTNILIFPTSKSKKEYVGK